MSKEGEAHVHNVMMFPLCDAILLMGVRTGNLVGDAKFVKVGIEMLIFTTPVKLNRNNLHLRSTRD
jgi:hypothetical protein